MKRYLLIALAILAGLLWVQTARLQAKKADNERLAHNQTALMSDMVHYRTKAGQEAASAQVLRLKVGEFEQLRAADAATIRDLGIKLKRVEATAKTATQTVVELRTRLRDTIVVRGYLSGPPSEVAVGPIGSAESCYNGGDPEVFGPPIVDTLKVFRWRDPWVSVEGLVDRDSVACRVASIDTLRQVIHRVPRRFLFIRYGTKAIRQEIVSSNPHTRIVYAEFVKFEK